MKVTRIHRYGENRQYISGEAVSSRGIGWRFSADIDGVVSPGGIFVHDPNRDTEKYECWWLWRKAPPVALREAVRKAVAS